MGKILSKTYTVFAYGSLMKGYYGYKTIMQSAEFLGEASVNGDLRFFCSDYPVLVHKPKNGKTVKGELYRVDEETMDKIRKYEGIGNPFTVYTETVLKAETDNGTVTARSFVCIPRIVLPMMFTTRHIPEGDWHLFKASRKRLPIPKPLMLFVGACALGAAAWEIFNEMGIHL